MRDTSLRVSRNSIRLWRVVLLRSDIRLTPSDIRYASFVANKISLKPQGFNITISISDNITPTKSEYNSCFLCRFVV